MAGHEPPRLGPPRAGRGAIQPRPENPWTVELSSCSSPSSSARAWEGERGRGLGVTAELSEIAAMERDQRGDIHPACWAAPPGRLARTAHRPARAASGQRARARPRPSGGSTALCVGRLVAASNACASNSRGRGLGPAQRGSAAKPPLPPSLLSLRSIVDRVKILLDQPGRPGHLPGGLSRGARRRRPSPCSADQAAALRCSAASRSGCLLLEAGHGAGRRTRWW